MLQLAQVQRLHRQMLHISRRRVVKWHNWHQRQLHRQHRLRKLCLCLVRWGRTPAAGKRRRSDAARRKSRSGGPDAARRSLRNKRTVLVGHQVARLQTAGSKRLRQRGARALAVRLVVRGLARQYGALLLERWRRLGVVARVVVARVVVARVVVARVVVARVVVVRGVAERGGVERRGAAGRRLAGVPPRGTHHRK